MSKENEVEFSQSNTSPAIDKPQSNIEINYSVNNTAPETTSDQIAIGFDETYSRRGNTLIDCGYDISGRIVDYFDIPDRGGNDLI